MTNNFHPGRHPKWSDLVERLENYKKMQREVAKKKGANVLRALEAAPTLTQARIAVYGKK